MKLMKHLSMGRLNAGLQKRRENRPWSTLFVLLLTALCFSSATNARMAANFVADKTTVNVGNKVKFTDTSTGYHDWWEWNFPGGTPSYSEARNPTVTYNTKGSHNVTLTIWSGYYKNRKKTKSNYITVVDGSPNPGLEKVDMVMYGGKIYTANQTISDPTQRFVQAVAVKGNTIVFAGSKSELDSNYDYSSVSAANKIDLKGALAVPGFHDVHMHPLEAADDSYTCVLVNQNDSFMNMTQIKNEVKGCNAGARGFILGWGHSIEKLLAQSENPKSILDALQPNTPVLIMERTSHSAWVNSAALSQMGITQNTPDPAGGRYVKGSNGQLNGILLDSAGDLAFDFVLNNPTTAMANKTYAGLSTIMGDVAKNGITTFVNARLYYKRNYQKLWKRANDNGLIKSRAHMALWVYPQEVKGAATSTAIAEQVNEIKNIASTYSDGLLQFDHIKFYSDGLVNNTTADVVAPYLEPYASNLGLGVDVNNRNYVPPSDMAQYIAALEPAGFTAIVHGIGDMGVRKGLDAIKQARNDNGNIYNQSQRHRITHVEFVHPDDISRFAAEDVVVDAQVSGEWTLPSTQHPQETALLGSHRTDRQVPMGEIYSAIKANGNTKAALTLSSDYDVSSLSPLVGIEHSLRRGSGGSLPDIYASVDAYTAKAAYALGNENTLGQIKAGMLADFTVINQDIFSITDVTKIAPSSTDTQGARVTKTIVDGKVIYSGN